MSIYKIPHCSFPFYVQKYIFPSFHRCISFPFLMILPKCLLLRESPIMVGQCSQMVGLGSICLFCIHYAWVMWITFLTAKLNRLLPDMDGWTLAPDDTPSKDTKWCVNCELWMHIRWSANADCMCSWLINDDIYEHWIQRFLVWKRMHRVKNSVPHTLDSEGNSWSKSLFLLMCSFLWLPCNHLCHFLYRWSHHLNNARDTQNIKTSPTCSSIELNCWGKLTYFCCQMPCSFVRIRPETSDCKIICVSASCRSHKTYKMTRRCLNQKTDETQDGTYPSICGNVLVFVSSHSRIISTAQLTSKFLNVTYN